MPLVNITNFNTDDDATANAFNSRFAAILNVLNGNIDQTNLATGAVATRNIADQAVTNNKLQPLQAARAYMADNTQVNATGWSNFPTNTTDYNTGFTISGGNKFTPTTPGYFSVSASYSVNDIAGASASITVAAIVVNTSDNTYTNRAISNPNASNSAITSPWGQQTLSGSLKVDAGQSILIRLFSSANVRCNGLAQRGGTTNDDKGNYTYVQITEAR